MTQAAKLAQLGSPGISTGFKNRIINGAMVIDQRNAGASVTPADGGYTLDRWQASLSQTSKYSVQQNAGSVTPPTGFASYLGVTSLSAYSVGSTETFAIQQKIEGYNTADLMWGTANAKGVTLSFWVRSSLTGTFGGALSTGGYARSYPFSYTISAANTWEYKTIAVAGDTGGTPPNTTNSEGVRLAFSLGSGTTRSGTAGSWSSSVYTNATGATSVVGTNGATFYVTGVQLEVGTTATDFEYRDYGRELILCQRYYFGDFYAQGGTCYSGTDCPCSARFPVTMRAAPTVNLKTGTTVTIDVYGGGGGPATLAFVDHIGSNSARVGFSLVGSGGSKGNPFDITGTQLQASAEL